VIPFFRYSWSQGKVTNVKHFVGTGCGFDGPFGRSNDFAGIAGSWGKAATGSRQSQWVVEGFYRFQLAPRV
jgi:carbohydrate-selective porin OprB